MIDTPDIVQVPTQLTAIIHLTIPREKIRDVMGPGIGELRAAVAGQGVATAGPWFTHHLRMEPGIFDFEISVPVTTPVAAVGRVRPSEWPAMTVARASYRGPYEGLGGAWGELDTWIAANVLKPAADLCECYVSGPESSADPATWVTELSRQITG